MKDALLIIRDQLTMGYKLSFAEAMLLQQAIDVAVSQAGNSPVIPEGYKLVPIEPTESMVIDGFESEDFDALADAVLDKKGWPYSCRESAECVTGIFKAMLAAAPAPTK